MNLKPQRVLHRVLAFVSREFEDFQVFPHRNLLAVSIAQRVVGDPKMAGREHVFAVLVVLERTRLTNQRVDHVAVVDRESADPDQPRHPLNREPVMRHVDPFGRDPDVDLLTDQTTGNRVGIAADLDRAAGADPNAENDVVGVKLAGGQWAQVLLLGGKRFLSSPVKARDHVLNELHVVFAAGEVTTSANQQSLVDGVFEMTVGRFHVTVLVGASSVCLLGGGTVMGHQCRVPIGQLLPRRMVVHRRAEAVGSMTLGHPAELPESRG